MIEEKYKQLCETPSDINEHLPTLRKYAILCESIVELGVRGMVSTWALLAGKPETMVSVDIVHTSEHKGNDEAAKEMARREHITWHFEQISSLDLRFRRCELLFIDTLHFYDQLSQELKLHSPHTTKYIIMHDTVIPEMQRAVDEFLTGNSDWKIKEVLTTLTGLTVLQRV